MSFKFDLYALLLRKNNKHTENPVNCLLHDDASAGMRSPQTFIIIKICQTPWNGFYIYLCRDSNKNVMLLTDSEDKSLLTSFQTLKPEPLVFWFYLKLVPERKLFLLGSLHVKHKFSESHGPLFKKYFAFRITSYFSLFSQKNSKTILIRQTLTTVQGNQWIPSYMYVVFV